MFFFCVISVYESFKEYIAVETLDGDNKYDAGEYGLQVSTTAHAIFFKCIQKGIDKNKECDVS